MANFNQSDFIISDILKIVLISALGEWHNTIFDKIQHLWTTKKAKKLKNNKFPGTEHFKKLNNLL